MGTLALEFPLELRIVPSLTFALALALAACGKGPPAQAPTAPPATTAPAAETDTAPAVEADTAPAADADTAPAADADAAPTAEADGGLAAGPVAAADEAAARALVASWVKAQNDGDFAAYMGLYDASFKGVKRTAKVGATEYDLAAWRADREKMFSAHMEVAAEIAAVAPGGAPGTTAVSLVQRWRSGKYADHGQKVLMVRADAGGVAKIVGEEMRTSERGWEDSKIKPSDLTGMKAPLTLHAVVERKQPPPDAMQDCLAGTLRLTVEDAAGGKLALEVGIVTGMALEDFRALTPVAPGAGGFYEELGEFCAGLGEGWRVEKDGDVLVATDVWNDEDTGEGKERHVLAQLPARAAVKFE